MTDTKKHVHEDEVLSKEELEQIKTDLLVRKQQILKDLGDIEDKDTDKVIFPDYGDKPDENAQEIDEYTTNLAADKVLDSTLRDIEATLGRIEKGTYGQCKYCSKMIPKKRLLARPVASACVECKTKLQNQE